MAEAASGPDRGFGLKGDEQSKGDDETRTRALPRGIIGSVAPGFFVGSRPIIIERIPS